MPRTITPQKLWFVSLVAVCAPFVRAETTGASYPLMSNCFEDAERLGDVTASDQIRVRSASAAAVSGSCYAVQVTKQGKTQSGFLINAPLPAIQQFEKDVRRHVPELPKPAPPVAAAAAVNVAAPPKPEPPGPTTLSGLRGLDVYGLPIDLNQIQSKSLVVYFWSTADRKSADMLEAIEYITEQYAKPQRLEVVGVMTTRTAEQAQQMADHNQIAGTQIVDRGQLAARYHINPARPYLILDRSRKVVAALASTQELEKEIRRLGLK